MREKPFDSLALVLDIETVAIPDADQFIEPATAPANYRDQAKIDLYIQEKTVERLATAALDPDLNRIVALGWQLEERDLVPIVHVCRDEDAERRALIAFWDLVACDGNRTRKLITYNGLQFDLPTLMRRSTYLEIWPSRALNIDRYRSPHVDLYQYLSFNGLFRHGLRFYAKRFGLEIDAEELTGADIASRVEANDWSSVERHCRSDVALTYQLAERLRFLAFDEDAHDEAVRSERRSA